MSDCTVSSSPSRSFVSSRTWLIAPSMLGTTVTLADGSNCDHLSANICCCVSFSIALGSYWWFTKSAHPVSTTLHTASGKRLTSFISRLRVRNICAEDNMIKRPAIRRLTPVVQPLQEVYRLCPSLLVEDERSRTGPVTVSTLSSSISLADKLTGLCTPQQTTVPPASDCQPYGPHPRATASFPPAEPHTVPAIQPSQCHPRTPSAAYPL